MAELNSKHYEGESDKIFEKFMEIKNELQKQALASGDLKTFAELSKLGQDLIDYGYNRFMHGLERGYETNGN